MPVDSIDNPGGFGSPNDPADFYRFATRNPDGTWTYQGQTYNTPEDYFNQRPSGGASPTPSAPPPQDFPLPGRTTGPPGVGNIGPGGNQTDDSQLVRMLLNRGPQRRPFQVPGMKMPMPPMPSPMPGDGMGAPVPELVGGDPSDGRGVHMPEPGMGGPGDGMGIPMGMGGPGDGRGVNMDDQLTKMLLERKTSKPPTGGAAPDLVGSM